MKHLLSFIFSLISVLTYCQTSPITQFWEKAIARKVRIPIELYNDSCYYSNTLLKVEFDNNSKVTSFQFSDNAEEWLSKELTKITGSLDLSALERYADSMQLKKRSVIVPVIISSQAIRCGPRYPGYWFNSRYYSFNEKLLEGNCLFVRPLEIVLQTANH